MEHAKAWDVGYLDRLLASTANVHSRLSGVHFHGDRHTDYTLIYRKVGFRLPPDDGVRLLTITAKTLCQMERV